MGVGMAFFEETIYDQRYGIPINSNLADYIVATHADAPEIDVTFLDYPDTVLNEFGARGVGEIGQAGIAAALTSAVTTLPEFGHVSCPYALRTCLLKRAAEVVEAERDWAQQPV